MLDAHKLKVSRAGIVGYRDGYFQIPKNILLPFANRSTNAAVVGKIYLLPCNLKLCIQLKI